MPQLPVPVAPAVDVAHELVETTPAFDAALDSALSYARASKAKRTVRAYASAFTAFCGWCREVGAVPMPASPETAASFLASLANRGCRASTIALYAAAIAYAHRTAGVEPPTNGEAVKAVLQGIRNSIGTRAVRKAPVTAEVLKKILKKIPETSSGSAIALLIGFAAALRRSELVALQVADIERSPLGVVIHIARSKTDQERAGHEVAIPAGSKLKPVQALDAWLSAAAITAGPVFRPVMKGARVGPAALTDRSAAQIVKDRAGAAGFDGDLFSGHSLRAGFVTSALHAGADLLKVMDVTRHRSVETLKVYDRRDKAFDNHAGKGFL